VEELRTLATRLARRRALLTGLTVLRVSLVWPALLLAGGVLVFVLSGDPGSPVRLLLAAGVVALPLGGLAAAAMVLFFSARRTGNLAIPALRADRVWNLEDRLSTALEAGEGSPMARALVRDVLRRLPAPRRGAEVYPLRRPVLRLAPGLLLLVLAFLLLLGSETFSPRRAGEPRAGTAPLSREEHPPRKKKEHPRAGKGRGGGGAEKQAPREPQPARGGRNPSKGKPLPSPGGGRKGRFEKVFVKPLFTGDPAGRTEAAPPEAKRGPGTREAKPPLAVTPSLGVFRKRAEAAMRRGSFSQEDQRLVTAYFESVEKRFEKE